MRLHLHMRKQYVCLLGVCVVLVALGAGTAVSAAKSPVRHGLEHWYYRAASPAKQGPPRLGISAIHPQPVLARTANASTPAFAAKDVESYIGTHPRPGKADVTGLVKVEKVEFLPTDKVNDRLKTTINRADSTLLCLVQLHGNFTAQAPRGVKGRPFTVLYQVFDARTGDLLAEAG